MPPIQAPFAASRPVETPAIQAVPLGSPLAVPEGVGFLDGIQRYAVEGRFGLVPLVRGYVAAAVLRRVDGRLKTDDADHDEFLVVRSALLTAEQRAALAAVGLPVHSCDGHERLHPLLEVHRAALVVETRREAIERTLAQRYRVAHPEDWLVVDGSLEGAPDDPRTLGIVKSHETQFLDGRDLEVALTLPAGHRSSVFARTVGRRREVYTWYLRLWPWSEHDLLHGLVRVERAADERTVREATAVSRWLLAERSPLAAPDARWDRLLYPIAQVEAYLRAQLGGFW